LKEIASIREEYNYFFSLYGIGSAITDKQNPRDTDLLLVANVFPNNEIANIQPSFLDLVAKLNETHEVNVDMDVRQKTSRFPQLTKPYEEHHEFLREKGIL
jgi:hypothetical protein